jgi:peptide/nickel transport system substrate-binding protein
MSARSTRSRAGMRIRSKRLSVAVITIVALLLAAGALSSCGSSDEPSSTSSTATSGLVSTTTPGTGTLDEIVWDLPQGEPTTLDPVKAGDYGPCFVSSQLHDTLVRYTPDWKLGPGIAESWNYVNDKTLVFTIRQDAKFWDGNPVTADDVLYSLQRSATWDSGSIWAGFFSNVKSMEKTGDWEVTIKFSNPDELLLKELATSGGGIVEKSYVEKVGDKKYGAGMNVMGSGPYKITSWKSGSEITLEAVPGYWDPSLQPKIQKVALKFITDTSTMTSALLSGELDGAYEISPTSIPAFANSTTGKVYLGPSLAISEIAISNPDGPMGNPQLRTALAMALDRKAIVEKVYNGAGVPNKTFTPPSAWDPEALDVYQKAYDEITVPGETADIEGAKQIVAGESGADKPMVMAVMASDQLELQLGSIVQQAAKDIGMTIKLKQLQPMDMSNYFYVPEYRKGIDMAVTLGFLDVPDPLDYTSLFFGEGALFNWINYSNPEVEQLLTEARQTMDPTARANLFVEAQAQYMKDMIVIPIAQNNVTLYMNNRISGAPVSFTYMWLPGLAMLGGTQ